MRLRFRSLRSIFAPYQEELACGVHELSFTVPPDSSEYQLDLFLVHVDGEGMGEPPYSRLYPQNLVNHNDGPAFYNVKAIFEGDQRLRVPEEYLQDEDDDTDPYYIRSAEEPIVRFSVMPRSPLSAPPGGAGGVCSRASFMRLCVFLITCASFWRAEGER